MLKLILFCILGTFSQAGDAASSRSDQAYPLDIELDGSLQNPAFSPDGKSIVFTRFRGGYNQGLSDLYLYQLDTGQLKALVADGSSNVNLPGSTWNSNIDTIVFSSERSEHDEIFMISAKGEPGDEMQITNRPNKQSYEPSFSPDGQWVVFETHNIDVEQGVITKYKTDGSAAYIDLSDDSINAKQPNWSPHGDKILYQQEGTTGWSIWTMDISGRHKTRVTSATDSATDAAFSQDGQWLVYSLENEDIVLANIYMTNLNTGEQKRMTHSSAYDGAPSIAANGRIAFESRNGEPDGSSGTRIWVIDSQDKPVKPVNPTIFPNIILLLQSNE